MLHIAPLTLEAQLCYLIGGALLCVSLSICGSLVWHAQGYYQPIPAGQRRTAGFTPNGILGVTCFFTFAGLAIVLLIESSLFYVRYAFHPSHKGRYWTMHRYASVILQAALGALYVATGVALLITWGGDSARCAFILCLGSDKYPESDLTRGNRFDIFLSLITFFVLVPTGLVLLYRVFWTVMHQRAARAVRKREAVPTGLVLLYRVFWTVMHQRAARAVRKREAVSEVAVPTRANPAAKPASMRPFRAELRAKQVCRLVGVCAGILAYAMLSFWLPNDSRRFDSYRIALFVRKRIGLERGSKNMTVPEMPDAWFRTGQIRVSDDLTLKLFPGNIFFYTYLLATAVIVFVLRLTQTGRYWVQRRIPLCACFTYGEAAFVAATTVLAVMFFIYWLHDHNYKNAWSVAAKPTQQIKPAERWGRGLGQLAILFLSLLLLPVGRQSVVVSVLGVSRDGLLWFHRAVGYAMLAATVGHIVAFYVSYASFGYLMQNLNTVRNSIGSKGVFDDYSVPVATWTTWFLLIAMGIFALNTVRRRYYELFYYTHLAATYMTLPVMVFHASAGWMYLLPGMTVLLADQLVRLWQRSAVVRVVHARVIGEDTTELAFSVPGRWDMRRVHPGQYVLVCVPELTALQWHPFTLTNVVDKESVAVEGSKVSATGTVFYVHVKSMGPRTWTGRLYDLVRTGQVFSMAVEGPCGTPVDYSHYDNIVLVAGGIGATPCISIFGSLLRQHEAAGSSRACPRVDFIWSTRSAHHVKAVADMLQLPVRCGNTGCTPSPRGVLIEKGDASPPPEDRVDNAKPNTEAAESGAILWDAGQLNGDVKAVSRAVHTPSDCEQYFSFDVFLTREGGLGHVFTGNDRIDGRTSPEPGKTSALKPYAELNEELQMDVVATGTPDCASHRAYPLGPASGAAKRAERRGKAGAAGGRSPSESVGNVIEDSEFSCADGSDERFEDVPVRTVVDDEPGETLDSASTVAEEDVSVSNGVSQWLPSSSGTWGRRSQREDDGSGRLALRMHAGRPDVVALIREALRKPGSRAKDSAKLNKTRTLLFVCGPSTLVCQVLSYGAQLGVTVHQEEFLL
ncbi:hypothetical protein JKF63_02948 [Porcisia hertigi]|uniref:FAD-binding FR-type domain-containing protein n=1 Tax=Porcisia hertigi TaxID=2761500 RepID=A0A836I5F6_9TRYP|nr:hypothetical protein JKF63_02948 [Porcisia hertigi]